LSDLAASNPDADGLVGAITPYAGETLPGPKYRWCHGTQTLSRTEFSLLFSRLGESWGVGDGSTTFNLPDFDKRFLVGVDGTGADTAYDRVGDAGGAASGTASGSVSGGTVAGTDFSVTGQGSTTIPSGSGGGNVQAGTALAVGGTGNLSGATFSGGVATVPPYKVVRYLIKVM
jgi:microcystin-dependent protein